MSQQTIERNDDGDSYVRVGVEEAELFANRDQPLRTINVSSGLRVLEKHAGVLPPRRSTAAVNAGFLTIRRTVPPVY